MGEYIEAKFDELKASGKMPSPKGVALAILKLAKKPDVTVDEIANVVKTDPSLSGNIIKAANSERSFYSRPIASAQVAVQRLGMSTVKSLALGFSLLDSYRKGRCQRFDYTRYWAEQLLRAIAVREIAIRTRIAPSEDIFSAALLGEIGRLALATIYPEDYSHVLERYEAEHSTPLETLEKQYFYIGHDELTRYILRDWGLPDILVESQLRGVQAKDAPDSRQYQLAMTFDVAKDIARLGVADSRSSEFHLTLDAKLAAAGLAEVGMDDLVENIFSEWQDWSHSFGLDKIEVSFNRLAGVVPEHDEAIPELVLQDDAIAASRVSVLVVDDELEMLEYVRAALSSPEYQIHTAENGEDALSKLVDVSPDIIISDWVMPELDGLGLCRVVRQSSEFSGVYFVMMTVDDSRDKLILAFKNGIDDYITKPFTPELLEARLRPGVRLTQMAKQAEQSKQKIEKLANELAIVNRKLSLSSLTDPLTKLPNRRYAMKRLEQEWSAAKRNNRPLTCMMMDIDFFKVINDSYGHGGGDTVLRNLSKILKGLLRTHDVACRMGGEEFMIICPDTDHASAAAVAERIRKSVERTVFPFGEQAIHITLSIGLASLDENSTGYDELINFADKKLYEAKASGRNLVL